MTPVRFCRPKLIVLLNEILIFENRHFGRNIDLCKKLNSMFYFITVNVYFNLVQENGVTSIALKTPLSVSESSYDRLVDQSSSAYLVTVEVRDSGNPPKVYSKQLNIIVSCKFCFLEMFAVESQIELLL